LFYIYNDCLLAAMAIFELCTCQNSIEFFSIEPMDPMVTRHILVLHVHDVSIANWNRGKMAPIQNWISGECIFFYVASLCNQSLKTIDRIVLFNFSTEWSTNQNLSLSVVVLQFQGIRFPVREEWRNSKNKTYFALLLVRGAHHHIHFE
jgi:hypothetical protein